MDQAKKWSHSKARFKGRGFILANFACPPSSDNLLKIARDLVQL